MAWDLRAANIAAWDKVFERDIIGRYHWEIPLGYACRWKHHKAPNIHCTKSDEPNMGKMNCTSNQETRPPPRQLAFSSHTRRNFASWKEFKSLWISHGDMSWWQNSSSAMVGLTLDCLAWYLHTLSTIPPSPLAFLFLVLDFVLIMCSKNPIFSDSRQTIASSTTEP